MEEDKSGMTALATVFVAFTVSVLLTAGLVVGLPNTIQEAQATTSPSRANEHISEQGRAHQSERGAERSGVREPVFCFEDTRNGNILCFDAQEECEKGLALLTEVSSECERFATPPPGALIDCIVIETGTGSIACFSPK